MDANPGLYLSPYLHVGAGLFLHQAQQLCLRGCAFVDTALEEVWEAGGQLFLQKVSVTSLQPQVPALVQEQPGRVWG